MRPLYALLLAIAVAASNATRSLFEEVKRLDALGVDDKTKTAAEGVSLPGSEHTDKPGANDCDKNKFREGINNCENGLKPLEKYLSEKKNDDSCKLLKIYLSCIEDFQLFLSCENDPASQREMAKATSIIVKNRLNCTELSFLTANLTSQPPTQNAAAIISKSTSPPTVTSAVTKASEKKCEERSLVLKLNQCVRLLNRTVEPILEDKDNNKLNICRASDTFLLCVNEAVSETACREDSEVMFHVSHFADKVLRHHKWSCEQGAASSNQPRMENLHQNMDAIGSGNLTAIRSFGGGIPMVLTPPERCNFEAVRTSVDTCQQSAYDQIKKKGISQPKHLCVELRIFKDCSIEATRKNGCATDKNAETYVYDRVKDSFYKYLTDCRPLWSAATPLSAAASFWALALAGLMVFAQGRH
ncbi:uncharacterized protein LOC144135268 isoform X3 [Amblyomma americanum]|uniref:Secreted protein n=1 Tax=Amblyomma americanum TaxID=6943 RepID=A0AAQ4FK45_AMBAM